MMQGRRNNNKNRVFIRTPPVSVGDELDVMIEAVGEKGDGVTKKDGFVIFVPNVKEGDKVRIKVSRVLKKVGFAEVIGKIEESKQGEDEQRKEQETQIEEAEPEFDESKDSEDFGEDLLENNESTEDTEDSNYKENLTSDEAFFDDTEDEEKKQ